jgi:hypothetical protein
MERLAAERRWQLERPLALGASFRSLKGPIDMERTLFLFQWNAGLAETRAARIRAAGWTVETESEDGARGIRNILSSHPTVVGLDLDQRPAASLQVAAAIRKYRDIRHLPLLFIGGSMMNVSRAQETFRGAAFVVPDMLITRLDGFDG